MWTILVMEGKVAKHAIGVFKTKAEAETWAAREGYGGLTGIPCKIIQLTP